MAVALRYQGARRFSTDSPALQRELQELAEQVDKLYRVQQDGGPMRLPFADVVHTSATLQLGYITPIQTTAATDLTLPLWDPTIVGLLCGIERRNTSHTLRVRSANALLNSGAGFLTVPVVQRTFLFLATPVGWSGIYNV